MAAAAAAAAIHNIQQENYLSLLPTAPIPAASSNVVDKMPQNVAELAIVAEKLIESISSKGELSAALATSGGGSGGGGHALLQASSCDSKAQLQLVTSPLIRALKRPHAALEAASVMDESKESHQADPMAGQKY